tara:strand:+ start:66521 stop:67141 length:621 start_codon:yes stop_codon:yes gene_type:complete
VSRSGNRRWHTNFRDVSKLPNLEEVKQQFMVSAIVLGLALVLMGFYIMGKTERIIVDEQIHSLEQTFAEKEANNIANIAADAAFQEKSAFIQEIDDFYRSGVDPVALFLAISSKRPKDLVFESFRLENVSDATLNEEGELYEVSLDGFIRSGYDEAFQAVKVFGRQLEKDPYLEPIFRDLEVEKLTRGAGMSKMMTFTIVIKLEIS